MPQIFIAVQCFECRAFQVQQEKKKPQFKCAVCGTQQTTQRIYVKSSKAKDCREVVANYNAARGAIHEQEYQLEDELPEYNEQEKQEYDEEHVRTEKWKEFVKADEVRFKFHSTVDVITFEIKSTK
jgi:hypothetical protein